MAPVLPAGAFYCLPVSAALQPALGPLGWIVSLALALLLLVDRREGRENLDKRKIK
jgi:hypothetical protein